MARATGDGPAPAPAPAPVEAETVVAHHHVPRPIEDNPPIVAPVVRATNVPQQPIAEAEEAEDDLDGAPGGVALRDAGWRIEVADRGARYIWRKGSHGNRISAPGGKFNELSEERKQQYAENSQRNTARRSSRTLGASPTANHLQPEPGRLSRRRKQQPAK